MDDKDRVIASLRDDVAALGVTLLAERSEHARKLEEVKRAAYVDARSSSRSYRDELHRIHDIASSALDLDCCEGWD